MCFIKTSCVGSRSLLDDPVTPSNGPYKAFDSKAHLSSETSFDSCQSFDSFQHFYSPEYALLSQMCASMAMNSDLLLKLHEDVCRSQNALEEAFQAIKQEENKATEEGITARETSKTSDPMVEKLFGTSSYRYRLRLKNKFPSLIYKERNMGLSVELTDLEGKLVLNSNLINLCMAVCDTNGQWISENEEGSAFLKGKTEVELYHGEVVFQKIYPRDVSRAYPEGKVNMVIYPKPSLVQFSSMSSSVEERVNALDIEPLLISDVIIRAKKKSTD